MPLGSYTVAGDILANTALNAEILVENCEVRNSRARALLFRTENITVRNCKFFGMSLPAILMAPYIVVWHEMSPVKKCAYRKLHIPKMRLCRK